MSKELKDLRDQIDDLNEEIVEVIAERVNVAEKIGEYKEKNNIQVVDENREQEVKDQFKLLFRQNGLPENEAKRLADLLIQIAVKRQKENKTSKKRTKI